MIAWANWDCPLPSTPAMPTISLACTSSEMPRTLSCPSSRTCRSAMRRTQAPRSIFGLFACRLTSRPTISRASSFPFVDRVCRHVTTRPSRITVTRSASSMISCSLCVTITMERPSALRPRSTVNRWSFSCGVRTAVGSSRIRTLASRYSSFRISTRCCTPMGSDPTRDSGSIAS